VKIGNSPAAVTSYRPPSAVSLSGKRSAAKPIGVFPGEGGGEEGHIGGRKLEVRTPRLLARHQPSSQE
jgi:hypothetical protein